MGDEQDKCGWETQTGRPCRNPATEADGTCWKPTHGEGKVAPSARIDAKLSDVLRAFRREKSVSDVADAIDYSDTRVEDWLHEDSELGELVRQAWSPSKEALAGMGRNGVVQVFRETDDDRVRLDAAKTLIENYDGDQEPDKVQQQIEQRIDDQRDPEEDDEAVGEALELLAGDGEAA